MTSEKKIRTAIWLKTLLLVGVYVAAIWTTDALLVRRYIHHTALSLGLSFSLVQSIVIGLLLAISVVTRFRRRLLEARSERIRPIIREALAAHLAGDDDRASIRRLKAQDSRDLEQCLLEQLASVHGSARERLSELAVELGFLGKWQKQYGSRNPDRRRTAVSRLGFLKAAPAIATLRLALSDEADVVKLEAARTLIQSGGTCEVVAVFRAALESSLLGRVVLAEVLRPYAASLCHDALSAVLNSDESKRVVAALEMVRAWGKSLPLPDLCPLLHHAEPAVRSAALRALPQASAQPERERQILALLSDDNESVQAAAAFSAGRLRLLLAVPALENCLRQSGPETALAAAYALAEIGPRGSDVLEQEVLAGHAAAGFAMEALAQLKLGQPLAAEL